MKCLILLLATIVTCHASPMKTHWRIVGGETAPDGAFPHMVSLRVNDVSHFCGGSILTPLTIITAAHCLDGFKPRELSAWVGSNQISTGGTKYWVMDTKIHPSYNDFTFDLGLGFMDRPIIMSDTVKPIAIGDTDAGAGDIGTLAGWGLTTTHGQAPNALQMIKLKILSNEDCEKLVLHPVDIINEALCAFNTWGEGTCFGDSGSPLDLNGELIALVSWAYPCAIGFPDVFVRIKPVKSWILENQVL